MRHRIICNKRLTRGDIIATVFYHQTGWRRLFCKDYSKKFIGGNTVWFEWPSKERASKEDSALLREYFYAS